MTANTRSFQMASVIRYSGVYTIAAMFPDNGSEDQLRMLDVNGNGTGVVTMPPIPALFGLCLYYSGFTLTAGTEVQTVFEWARSCVG